MRDKKGMDVKGAGKELRGREGGETVIRIYYVKKSLLQQRGSKKTIKLFRFGNSVYRWRSVELIQVLCSCGTP